MYYLTTFLSLLVISSALNCPLSQQQKSIAFSGLLSAQPDANQLQQNMEYTQNYDFPLSSTPQVCLCLSGYQDQNQGIIKISITTQSVTQKGFIVRVASPSASKWTKLDINYLASNKKQIQMGTVSTIRPILNNNGFISLTYTPTIRLTKEIKIRQFIVSLDIQAQNNGIISLNYQSVQITSTTLIFQYSSNLCVVNSMALSVVLFDPNTPGLLFIDGQIQQNSLSTTTEVTIDRTYMEQLRIYFVGFNSLNAKDPSALSLSISFSKSFSLMIDSSHIKSIKVNYLVISFVDCGSCTGYPYLINDICYANCPSGTILNNGICTPIKCGNGYQISNGVCVPVCNGANRWYNGKSCGCLDGYNMINGQCNKCPDGTYFNYYTQSCDSLCGPNASYNQQDRRCYCFSGYVVINNQCGTCPAGTQYNSATRQCTNIPINCNVNEVIAYGRCVCASNYYKINGVCQQCPPYSVYQNGACLCNDGYSMNNNYICVPNLPICQANQILIGNQCQCQNGYARNAYGQCVIVSCGQYQYRDNSGNCVCQNGYNLNNYGQCVPIIPTCPQFQQYNGRSCQCIAGYTRRTDGRCYPIQCQSGYYPDSSWNCIPRCNSANTVWDDSQQRCIPTCRTGYVYDYTYNTCVPVCQANYRWNGIQCQCYQYCPIVCPPGSYLDPSNNQNCISCSNGFVWNGQSCVCPSGSINYNGVCRPPCQAYSDWSGSRCACRQGYYEQSTGVCIIIPNCNNGQRWDNDKYICINICNGDRIWGGGNNCVCPPGTYDFNGACIRCNVNAYQQYNSNYGRCDCITNYYRGDNGLCQTCPNGYQWNRVAKQCIPIPINCSNGKIWNGAKCVCPQGTYQLPLYGTCRNNCVAGPGAIQLPNGQCSCQVGYQLNNYGACIKICGDNSIYINGACQQNCGQGQQWSGYNCVCRPNYERVAEGLCVQSCKQFQQRRNRNCQCIANYQRNPQGQCYPTNCQAPHQFINGICNCANGYQRISTGCVQSCQPGYIRNSQGYCVINCRNDQILVGNQCQCKVGLYNINGVCQSCPQYSTPVNGGCICIANNYPVSGGATCPAPQTCSDPYSYWDQSSQTCACRSPAIWTYGGCKLPQTCGQNQVWAGYDCVCNYGYYMVNGYCQPNTQTPTCPANSIFNGVNCQCLPGFYPQNNKVCQRCPNNGYWNGQQCGSTPGSCSNGWSWDHSKSCCVYQANCKKNQEWDGASCRCKQGYFYINGQCSQCPQGTVFDGQKCNRGSPSSQCRDPYSFYNGYQCSCIPNYWQLSGGCVTCPSGYKWNGVCCAASPTGFTYALADGAQNHMTRTAVPFAMK